MIVILLISGAVCIFNLGVLFGAWWVTMRRGFSEPEYDESDTFLSATAEIIPFKNHRRTIDENPHTASDTVA